MVNKTNFMSQYYSKKKDLELHGKRLKLSIFKPNEVSEKYLNWIKDPKISKFIVKSSKHTNLQELENLVNKLYLSKKDFFFRILLKKDNDHIGNVRIGPINERTGVSNFGILIGEKNIHNMGYAKETFELVKSFCFEKININTIDFKCVANNFPAMKLYKKMGCIEGKTSSIFYKDGYSYKQVTWKISNTEK